MANFTPPFADLADKRLPTSDERKQGFDCGPADRRLFNGLFHRIESELGHVITMAGIEQTDERLTLLYEAIQSLIEAATGGGDPANYLLLSQAATRLPIYPEVNNADGRIIITSPSTGLIRVPGGVPFLHRGISPQTTTQVDLPVTASKTYHLRWTPAGGFALFDLNNLVYNPSKLAETNPVFDSGYDDMLIARVVTNSANLATITNLANKVSLVAAGEEHAAMGSLTPKQIQDGVRPSMITQHKAVAIDFARTPQTAMTAINDLMTIPSQIIADEKSMGARTLSRYQVAVWGQGDVDIWVGWAARA